MQNAMRFYLDTNTLRRTGCMHWPSSLSDVCLSIYHLNESWCTAKGFCACAGSGAEAISAAQWRGMQALAVSSRIVDACFSRTSLAGNMHSQLLAQLRWLTATDTEEASTIFYASHAHMYERTHARTHARMAQCEQIEGGHI